MIAPRCTRRFGPVSGPTGRVRGMFATDEWVTISSLATAAGTLVLAVATFA